MGDLRKITPMILILIIQRDVMLTLVVFRSKTHRFVSWSMHIWTLREQHFIKECLDSSEDDIVRASHKNVALSPFRQTNKGH